MNKREYKKAISSLGTGMCVEIFNIGATTKGADANKFQEAISMIWNATEQTKAKANIFFNKGRRDFETAQDYNRAKHAFFKALFNRLNAEFEAQLDEALKLVNSATPA